jgi:LysM repeat protein
MTEKKEIRAKVCPYIGRSDDQESFFAFPAPANRCFRVEKPEGIAGSHQARFCLTARFSECPVNSPSFSGPLPVVIRSSLRRGRWRRLKRGTRLGLILLVSITILALIALWWFWNDIVGAPAPVSAPTHTSVSVNSQATIPPTRTDIPVLLPTNPPTPTPALVTPSPQLTLTLTPGPDLDTTIGPASPFLIHRVKEGDTLFYIAETFNSSVEAILAANGLEGLPLWVDKLLVIPVGDVNVGDLPVFDVYQVPPEGTTVIQVAELFHSDPEAIRVYNNLGEGEDLPSGRWLIVPYE